MQVQVSVHNNELIKMNEEIIVSDIINYGDKFVKKRFNEIKRLKSINNEEYLKQLFNIAVYLKIYYGISSINISLPTFSDFKTTVDFNDFSKYFKKQIYNSIKNNEYDNLFKIFVLHGYFKKKVKSTIEGFKHIEYMKPYLYLDINGIIENLTPKDILSILSVFSVILFIIFSNFYLNIGITIIMGLFTLSILIIGINDDDVLKYIHVDL